MQVGERAPIGEQPPTRTQNERVNQQDIQVDKIVLHEGLDEDTTAHHQKVFPWLLLGVGHDSDTTVHLGEAMAGVRYRRKKYLNLLVGGKLTRFDYDEIDHCCQNFNLVDGWLDEKGLQRRGRVGHGEARLVQSRDIVAVVVEHLGENETTFLHPFGVDEECDEARSSLDRRI